MKVFALLLIAVTANAADLSVEQTKKNIKVLHGLPSSQLIPVMAFMANSLGVTCGHCHGQAFDSDEKPAKDAARRMIALQRAINEQHFGGKVVVTCNTCHQGKVGTPATPNVADAGWNPWHPNVAVWTTGEAIIERLPKAKAGMTRRVIRGTVERYNGRDAPKSGKFTLTIGPTAKEFEYDTDLSHPPEAMRALGLFPIEARTVEQLRGERWMFSASKTLRYRETPTPLGNLPEEIEFEDFRETPSGRLPFRTRWSRADYRVTFTIDSVE
jgi:Photosynthetic reaction centre cytochrome C subunit